MAAIILLLTFVTIAASLLPLFGLITLFVRKNCWYCVADEVITSSSDTRLKLLLLVRVLVAQAPINRDTAKKNINVKYLFIKYNSLNYKKFSKI